MALIANEFRDDPRVIEGKRLIQEALQDHQKSITKIKPPDPTLELSYEDLLKEFASYRGNKLWFPFIGSGIGHGPLVELRDGSIKYDFITGIGSHFFGHSSPKMIEAALNAAIDDTIMQGHLQQNIQSIHLSKILIEASGLDHCFLCSTGVMANENGLKIAFQNKYPAQKIIAFEKCFVGRTLAASQITDKPAFRDGLPPLLHVDYIPFYDPARPEESTAASVEALKTHIKRYPKQHAVMILELVQGEGGFHVGSEHFFKALIEVLKNEGILILADEVQTFGRTYSLFAFQEYHLQEYVDIVTIGKLSQTCATLFRKECAPRPLLLSQTFTSSTSALHAAISVLNELIHGNYYGPNGKMKQIFQRFTSHFDEIKKRHPDLIHGPWGIGAMLAFTPYNGEPEKVTHFVHKLYQAGVMGFLAGSHPTRIRFLVPAIPITMRDIDIAVKVIEETLL